MENSTTYGKYMTSKIQPYKNKLQLILSVDHIVVINIPSSIIMDDRISIRRKTNFILSKIKFELLQDKNFHE